MKKTKSRNLVRRRSAAARGPIAAINRDLERLLDRPGRPAIDIERAHRVPELRVILQKPRRVAYAVFEARVRASAGAHSRVEPLFPRFRPRRDLPILQDFVVVTWPGLDSRALLAHPFDVAYALQNATKSVSAYPESDASALSSLCREPDSTPDPNLTRGAVARDHCNWFLSAANVPAAWDAIARTNIPDRNVPMKVGHIDTGVVHHRLLDPRVDFAGGLDFLRPGSPPIDPLLDSDQPADVPGHGTFSASVLMGSHDTHANTGFSGVAPDATLIPVRITRSVVLAPLSHLADAIHFLTVKGVAVISISLGGPSMSAFVHAAVNNAAFNNVIIVAAAGQCVKTVVMPAALRQVVAAAGTKLDNTDDVSDDFNALRDRLTLWGPSASGPKVAIAAPAKDICHASPNSSSPPSGVHGAIGGPSQGTTFATAIVAGAATLWLRRHGRARLLERYRNSRTLTAIFKDMLARSAYRNPQRWPLHWGPGVLDVGGLLEEPLPLVPPTLPSSNLALRQEYEAIDVVEWFEQVFGQLSPDAVRGALRRIFPAATVAEWRQTIDRLGAEAFERIVASEHATERFIETANAELASASDEAARRARDTASAIADDASRRLRDALPH
ncbi:MAG: S8/S53 family peptidase [Deltaproteobacteria bacterium]|nr:S8/S53 family peptidase [Deltaproteobacteria bacterium]